MPTIEDIRNIDTDKIANKTLRDHINNFLIDASQAPSIAEFEEDFQPNIVMYLKMVAKSAPEALPPSYDPDGIAAPAPAPGSKPAGPKPATTEMEMSADDVRSLLSGLKEMREDFDPEKDDYILMMIEGLEDELEGATEQTPEEMEKLVRNALEVFRIKVKDAAPKGETQEEMLDKATDLVNNLLKEYDMPTIDKAPSGEQGDDASEPAKPSKPSKPEPAPTLPTSELVQQLIDELKPIKKKAKGTDKDMVDELQQTLQTALNNAGKPAFNKGVEQAGKEFKEFATDMDSAAVRKDLIRTMNKLLTALGQKQLKLDGTEKKESEKAHNKKVEKQIESDEKKLAECRQLLAFNRKKKRELEGTKPPPTQAEKMTRSLLSFSKLVPKDLQQTIGVIEETEDLVLATVEQVGAAWSIGDVATAQVKANLMEHFDQVKQKINASNAA